MAEKLLWTVRDVMDVLPLGKTKCVAIVKSIPHINTGRKLLVEPQAVMNWIRVNMVQPDAPVPVISSRKARAPRGPELTKDGLIPRRTK